MNEEQTDVLTEVEKRVEQRLCKAFVTALARAGIYTVTFVKESFKQAIEKDDVAAVEDILHKCPRAARAKFDKLLEDPFRYALSQKSFGAARAILKAHPRALEACSWWGNTPILDLAHDFTLKGDTMTAVMRELVSMGANIHAQDRDKSSALHQLAGYQDAGAVEVLLTAGAKPDARNCAMATPLFSAAMHDSIPAMEALANHGANLQAVDKDGCNATTSAIYLLKFDAALWLMKKGVLPDFDRDLEKELKIAQDRQNVEFVAAFREREAAWKKMRKAAEVDYVAREVQQGLPKPMKVQPFRLKAAP